MRDPEGKWDISAFVRNLTDKNYFNTKCVNSIYGTILASLGEPRIIGAALKTRF